MITNLSELIDKLEQIDNDLAECEKSINGFKFRRPSSNALRTASHCIDEAEVYTMHTVRELREFLSELQKEIPINAEEIKSTTVSQDSTQ